MPAQLGWPGPRGGGDRGTTRGWLGQAVLSGFQVLTGIAQGPGRQARRRRDHEEGRRQGRGPASIGSRPGRRSSRSRAAAASSTRSPRPATAGRCWCSCTAPSRTRSARSRSSGPCTPRRCDALFASYDDRVYGLDHPTLGVSPIANALTLAARAAGRARASTSSPTRAAASSPRCWRARAAAGRSATTSSGSSPARRTRASQRPARAGQGSAGARGSAVERVVRVACPARGTLLASKRLDAYLSVLNWASSWPAPGRAGAGRLPARGRAPSRRARRAARPRGA